MDTHKVIQLMPNLMRNGNEQNISNNNNTNNNENKISEEQYQNVLSKLGYELSNRKNEFLNCCAKINSQINNFSTKITSSNLKIVLNEFTSYLNEYEKDLIIYKFKSYDDTIDFDYLSSITDTSIRKYDDESLQFLNENKQIKNVNKRIDISPMEELNKQIHKENFQIKIAKNIMKDLLVNSDQDGIEKYLEILYNKTDFDNDRNFTIGELKVFLNYCDIYLSDSDLKYFFEQFQLIDGRMSIIEFDNFIKTFSNKSFQKPARTDFTKNYDDQQSSITNTANKSYFNDETKGENYYSNIMKTNYIIDILRKLISFFGKNKLYEYFSKYIELHNNEYYIENYWLEAGINSLGYRVPESSESKYFKLLCVHKRLANIENETEMRIMINLERLFNEIIDYFNMGNMIKSGTLNETLTKLGIVYLNQLNENFLSSVTNKINRSDLYDCEIDEFTFRKKFIETYNFIDHYFLDETINSFIDDENDNYINNNDKTTSMLNKCPQFKIRKISTKKYLSFAYNIAFMTFIENFKQLDLLIDEKEDQEFIIKLSEKIKNKLFPNYLAHKKNMKIDASLLGRAIPKNSILPKIKTFDFLYQTNKSANNEFILGSLNKINIKVNNTSSGYINSMEKNSIESNRQIRNAFYENKNKYDPIEIVPKLFEKCKNYIQHKYQFDSINANVLKHIDGSTLFKDQLINQNIDIKKKLSINIFWNIFQVEFIEDDLRAFVDQIAKNNSDKQGNINLPLFLGVINDILLQYCKNIYKNNN